MLANTTRRSSTEMSDVVAFTILFRHSDFLELLFNEDETGFVIVNGQGLWNLVSDIKKGKNRSQTRCDGHD